MKITDKFLSVIEASEYLKERGIELKPGTLRTKIRKQELPYYALGRPKFKSSDLDRYIESKRVRANRWPDRKAM